MTRTKIKSLIRQSIRELQRRKIFLKFGMPDIKIEKPEEKNHGDYSTNIAMILGRVTGKSPMEIADFIVQEINKKQKNIFKKIEKVKPGFINFFLSEKYLQKKINEVLRKGEKFGTLNIGKNRKIEIEFISANPTGPLTVANSRGGPFGDVLGNVFKRAGFLVKKDYYINDYGMQILALGHSVLKDGKAQYRGSYIDYLNKKIRAKYKRLKDPYKIGKIASRIIIKEMIRKTTDRMRVKYDEWFSEEKLHKSGLVDETLKILNKKNLIYKKEGALWFKSSKYGDTRDRVVVKSDNSKTYLAGDIAYHRYKFKKKRFDKVIDIWGADHIGDVPGLQAGVAALGYKNKLDIVILQFVTLFEKKKRLRMSKRRGIFVAMDDLLDIIPVDVVRFFFLEKSPHTHLNFDLDLARTQSKKNPVYYIQYAYARICAILRKFGKSQFLISNFQTNSKFKIQNSKLKLLKHPLELALIKELIRFPEIIEDTAKDYQVQRLPQYALDLAVSFHQFYRDCQVLSDDEDLTRARLYLILAVQCVLKSTLDTLGISAPERM